MANVKLGKDSFKTGVPEENNYHREYLVLVKLEEWDNPQWCIANYYDNWWSILKWNPELPAIEEVIMWKPLELLYKDYDNHI